jgi:hypothetical protein
VTVDQLYEAIRALPVAERLRLVERVVHDVAVCASPANDGPRDLLGMFADAPDLIDQVCAEALAERRSRPWRSEP